MLSPVLVKLSVKQVYQVTLTYYLLKLFLKFIKFSIIKMKSEAKKFISTHAVILKICSHSCPGRVLP